ncbi:hypothetical protein AB6A40_010067 [Gnathostoma spinigerum]|uniref:Sushi domain-containing protein n=1 Tax=Gnathostoma spinigerum TaxID=75299 RepID=A0ABD6EU67_9BILA
MIIAFSFVFAALPLVARTACPPHPQRDGGTIHYFARWATLVCHLTYVNRGRLKSTCIGDHWDAPLGTCEKFRLQCKPMTGLNGVVTYNTIPVPHYVLLTEATLSCSGSKSVQRSTCMVNGWKPSLSACAPPQCKLIGSVSNGMDNLLLLNAK